MMTIAEMLVEDAARRSRRDIRYDPLTGRGASGERIEVDTPVEGMPRAFVPVAMTADPQYALVRALSLIHI